MRITLISALGALALACASSVQSEPLTVETLLGLFDLRRAAIVVLGIVVVFGAAEIVNLITGGS